MNELIRSDRNWRLAGAGEGGARGGRVVDWTVALYRAKKQAILDSVMNFLFPQKVKNYFPPYIPVFTCIIYLLHGAESFLRS